MAQSKSDMTIGPYPSSFVSKEEKMQAAWLTQYAAAVWQDIRSNRTGITDQRERFVLYRKWAEGLQDMEAFKTLMRRKNKAADTLAYNVSHPIPTIVNSLVASLQNQDYKPSIFSISPETRLAKEKRRRALEAKRVVAMNAGQYQELGVNVSEIAGADDTFQTKEEIELHLETDFKDDFTISMQPLVDLHYDASNKNNLERDILNDLVKICTAGLRAYRDVNMDVRVRNVDPVRFFSSPVIKSDYSDAKHMGEERLLTIDDLAIEAQGEISDEDLFKAAYNNRTLWNNAWNDNWGSQYYPKALNMNGTRPWGSLRALVLDIEVRSQDQIGKVVEEHKRSKTRRYKTAKDISQATDIVKVMNLYQINYIPSLNKIYRSGLSTNMVRPKVGSMMSLDTPFNFVMESPAIYEGRNKGIVEKLIPDAQGIILTKLHEQAMVARMKPRSISLDMYAVAAALNGLGDKSLKHKDLIAAYEAGDPMLYSSVVGGQNITNVNPVRELPESELRALPPLQALKQSYLQSMELGTGVPLSTVGSIDKDSLVGIQKQQTMNRNNAIRYIDQAYRSILTRTTELMIAMIQDNIEMSPKKAREYADAVGQANIDTIKVVGKLPLIQFGTSVETAPDMDELQALYNNLDRAIVAKQIKESDAMKVRRLAKRNVLLAEKYMQVWENKYLAQQAEQAEVGLMNQSKYQTEGAIAVEKENQKTILLQHQLAMEKLKVETMLSIQEGKADFENDARLKYIQGEIDRSKILLATQYSEGKSSFEKTNLPKNSGQRLMSVR